MVEESLNKAIYKLVLYSVKIIPMIVSGIYLLNTILSYFYIDLPILSYIVQYLLIGFLYAASYAFRFCAWHRMFIHYILIVLTVNIVDYHIGIPISDRDLFLLYFILSALFLFIVVYLKFKVCKKD